MDGGIFIVPINTETACSPDQISGEGLHIHVQRVSGEDLLSFTAVFVNGSYHAKIPSPEALIHILLAYWDEYIPYLCGEAILHQPQWVLSAKFVDPETLDSSSQSVARQAEKDHLGVVVSIKTLGDLPVTMGSIKLEAVDFHSTTSPLLQKESNLFNWLEALQLRNKGLIVQVNETARTRDQIKRDFEDMKAAYETAVLEHALIVRNLEQAFYALLNAKKDKIWELSKGNVPQDRLYHLKMEAPQSQMQVQDESRIKTEPVEGMICNTNSELRESVYEFYDATPINTDFARIQARPHEPEDPDVDADRALLRTESMYRGPPEVRRNKRTFSELSSDNDTDHTSTEEDDDDGIEGKGILAVDSEGKDHMMQDKIAVESITVKNEKSNKDLGDIPSNKNNQDSTYREECKQTTEFSPNTAFPIQKTTHPIEPSPRGDDYAEQNTPPHDVETKGVCIDLDVVCEKVPFHEEVNCKNEESPGISGASQPIVVGDDATDYESSESDH